MAVEATSPRDTAAAWDTFVYAEELNASLFRALVDRFPEDRRTVVLDLGPARAANVAFFGQFPCRLCIADARRTIEVLEAETDPQALRERIDALLADCGPEPADVVLYWDLLNYLPQPALTAFTESVAARVRPGAFVHGLITSVAQMPAQPGLYDIVDAGCLRRTVHDATLCSAPRYTAKDLERYMVCYTVERAVLLSSGVQEYLLRVQPPASSAQSPAPTRLR